MFVLNLNQKQFYQRSVHMIDYLDSDNLNKTKHLRALLTTPNFKHDSDLKKKMNL